MPRCLWDLFTEGSYSTPLEARQKSFSEMSRRQRWNIKQRQQQNEIPRHPAVAAAVLMVVMVVVVVVEVLGSLRGDG